MTVTLRALGSTGVVAIYTGSDDAPFSSPLSHLSNGRLKYHSSLDYPKVIDQRVRSVTFPSRTGSGGVFTQSHTLFAHGRGGQPWVLASAKIGSNDVALTGSVPVQRAMDVTFESQWARWVTVGADSTNVYAFEYTVKPTNYVLPAITIPFTIWVTDELL
jgi:hypothetical protein